MRIERLNCWKAHFVGEICLPACHQSENGSISTTFHLRWHADRPTRCTQGRSCLEGRPSRTTVVVLSAVRGGLPVERPSAPCRQLRHVSTRASPSHREGVDETSAGCLPGLAWRSQRPCLASTGYDLGCRHGAGGRLNWEATPSSGQDDHRRPVRSVFLRRPRKLLLYCRLARHLPVDVYFFAAGPLRRAFAPPGRCGLGGGQPCRQLLQDGRRPPSRRAPQRPLPLR